MSLATFQHQRVVSGMRTTGAMHIGHYHGVLKNWLSLQYEYECFFFAADLHALTTEYEDPRDLGAHTMEMVIDWLSVGVNPSAATLFIQSHVPEHAELHLLLSMLTPLSWLERVPTYKDQQEKLKQKDLSTYGFLGYPLLQAADILLYKAKHVPVGEDQVPHVELVREVARRFNHFYGKEKDYVALAETAISKLGKKYARLYREQLRRYQEQGEAEGLLQGRALIEGNQNITIGDKERLLGFLEGSGKIILPEPQALLTKEAKVTGLDGQKMSKSYNNVIRLREEQDSISEKIKTMQTDPARVRRNDPGTPEKCPVWPLHQLYSDTETCDWVQAGCRHASIGCIDCKRRLCDAIVAKHAPFIEAAKPYQEAPQLVRGILADGAEKARDIARQTLGEVKEVMGIDD